MSTELETATTSKTAVRNDLSSSLQPPNNQTNHDKSITAINNECSNNNTCGTGSIDSVGDSSSNCSSSNNNCNSSNSSNSNINNNTNKQINTVGDDERNILETNINCSGSNQTIGTVDCQKVTINTKEIATSLTVPKPEITSSFLPESLSEVEEVGIQTTNSSTIVTLTTTPSSTIIPETVTIEIAEPTTSNPIKVDDLNKEKSHSNMQKSVLNPTTSSLAGSTETMLITTPDNSCVVHDANNPNDSTQHCESRNGDSQKVVNDVATNGHENKHNGIIVNDSNSDNADVTGVCDDQVDNQDAVKTVAWMGKTNQDIIRLIGQYLQDLGLENSVKTLMNESGCYLEHPSATKFREHVLSGEWSKADADMKELESLIENGKPSAIIEMKFLLLEQKYLEYLDDGCPLDALHVLRNELTPLQYNISRVHQLSSYMMCSNNHDLYQRSKWEGKGILSRALVMERLQAFLPPSVMMSPRRLRTLLQQAVELQAQRCPCHDMAWETNLQNVSLLTDHCCATEGFPIQTIQILTDHCDEVWYCKFSPDGLKLATGSKDAIVIIWDVDPFKLQLKQRRIIDSRFQMSVAFISWSPDSKLVLVGGPEDSSEVCIFNVMDGRLILKMSHNIQEDSFSCGVFNRDGTRFVCGGQKGQFYLCDLKATILDSWEGVRINSVVFRSDNKTILAADSHYRIRGYNFENPRNDYDVLKETHPIMTFTLNTADRLALLNISNQGLHLWDIEDKCLVRRFQGVRQSNFAIHSCFGGVNESFVASGSEDKNVVIWHIRREEPLARLAGHTKTVNCVSWNPVYPSLLASASDDATVRIWGPSSVPHAGGSSESDDCSSCSSSSSWNITSYSH